MTHLKLFIIIFFTGTILWSGCKRSKSGANNSAEKKELIIYCENSMLDLVIDLKNQFETKYNCSVKIQNDCSQNLIDLVSYTGKGDLYIPSSTASFAKFYRETGQALMDSVFIGYNSLVFMVKKGNSKKFDGRFSSLLNKDKYPLIIANPETSSLGFETRHVLRKYRIYEKLLPNIVALTSDSKGLVKGLRNDQADVVIDWESNYFANDNSEYVDVIHPESGNDYVPIYAASLSCSSDPTLTNAFLEFANTQLNESRLSKYGYTRRKTIIF